MHYVTHQFAHHDALERARKWLLQLGFDPGQIETHTEGVPRISVRVAHEQIEEVELVINAAELADPYGWPSFWELAPKEQVAPVPIQSMEFAAPHLHQTTPIGWHPPDSDRSREKESSPYASELVTRFS